VRHRVLRNLTGRCSDFDFKHITIWAARWLQRPAMTVQPGSLAGCNERTRPCYIQDLLLTLCGRGAYVCTRTNPPPGRCWDAISRTYCSCGRKLLPCTTRWTNPDSRPGEHVSLFRCDEASVTVMCTRGPSRIPGHWSSCVAYKLTLQVILCLTLPAADRIGPCLSAYQVWRHP
jgi:hypothetical protein